MPTNRNTADPEKPRRRWFQFRLRTLLIGVALIGPATGYFHHAATIVRERKAWIAAHSPKMHWGSLRGDPTMLAGDESQSPGILRRWLGDKPMERVDLYWGERVESSDWRRLFPEATITLYY
jgi:hypothetical protein